MDLINEEIRKLLEDIRVGCGMTNCRKLTEEYEDSNLTQKKLEIINPLNSLLGPGSKVKIYWKQFKGPDNGYIFTLPGFDEDDIFMSGIVHIPLPQGGDKSQCSGEWVYLDRLLGNPQVVKVELMGEFK